MKVSRFFVLSFLFLMVLFGLTFSANAALVDNGDGTITDTDTLLMWQQEDDNIARMYELAITYCENLVFPPSRYGDWRLPNRRELRSIIDNSQWDPAIDSTAFPNTDSSHYWSSTTATSLQAWSVDFTSGNVIYYDRANSRYVRCVRGGQ